MEIILASQSPRRRELLERMGLSFTVRAADIDETMDPEQDPAQEMWSLPQTPLWSAADAFWESPVPASRRRRCCSSCPAGTTRS